MLCLFYTLKRSMRSININSSPFLWGGSGVWKLVCVANQNQHQQQNERETLANEMHMSIYFSFVLSSCQPTSRFLTLPSSECCERSLFTILRHVCLSSANVAHNKKKLLLYREDMISSLDVQDRRYMNLKAHTKSIQKLFNYLHIILKRYSLHGRVPHDQSENDIHLTLSVQRVVAIKSAS